MRAGDQFLEWAEYSGNLYGTAQVDTERALAEGDDLVLVIDVQGGRKVRDRGWPALYVFLLPPSFAELEARLRSSQGDTEEQIQQRLATARVEVAAASEYDYVLINETVEACVERLRAIVLADRGRRVGETGGACVEAEALAEAARRDAMAPVVAPILAGFAHARS
jgi:guanylate kinase